jgi:SAM-dependent methyltransferase
MANQSYFDSWSTDIYGDDLIFQRTIHTFTSGLVRGDTLDIGCGSRVWYDVTKVTRWVGIDISEAMLRDLRFYGGPPPVAPELIHSNSLDAEFPEKSFDTACSIFLLHHLAKDTTKTSRHRVTTMMRKVFGFLKPGGRFLIAENAAKALEAPYHLAFAPLYSAFRKLKSVELPHFWTANELVTMLDEAGFEDVVLVHIPIRERIENPMSGVALPPWLINQMQQMTLLVGTKPAH